MTGDTRIEYRAKGNIDYFFNVDNATNKAVRTGIKTHRFQQGQGRTHAIGCGALKREKRGTAAVNDGHRNHVEAVYVGFRIEEVAEIIFGDIIAESDMTIENAIGEMGKCKCVKN